ncbi:MAG: methyltransferase domain-containing protein [Phycisphaerales bacterium]|nr:methyltransferase domain-containing protein [Phycisphaerales bacterium]
MTTLRTDTPRAKPVHAMQPSGREIPGNRTFTFFREFFRSPRLLGTCFPCSKQVAAAMTDGIGLETAMSVAEFGPGTGAITPSILERINPDAVYFAIERNDVMAAAFRARFPQVTLHEDDARNIRTIMRGEGVEKLDIIVSALPWLIFPEEVREPMLTEAVAALKPGGIFSQITYFADSLPAAKKFRRLMERHFSEIRAVRRVWRNLPPAFVYHCVK